MQMQMQSRFRILSSEWIWANDVILVISDPELDVLSQLPHLPIYAMLCHAMLCYSTTINTTHLKAKTAK